ncbi:DUF3289 family protein [Mucilaginibacter sp.]
MNTKHLAAGAYLKKIGILLTAIILLLPPGCKKYNFMPGNGVPTTAGQPFDYNLLPADMQIQPAEINQWLSAHIPQEDMADLQLSQVQQNLADRHHVIKIPLKANTALFITKQEGRLQAYAYKFEDKQPGTPGFTGHILSYSFQSGQMRAMAYLKGRKVRDAEFAGEAGLASAPAQPGGKLLAYAPRSKPHTSTDDGSDVLGDIWCLLTGGTPYALVGSVGNGCDRTSGWFSNFVRWVGALFSGDGTGGTDGGEVGGGGTGGGGGVDDSQSGVGQGSNDPPNGYWYDIGAAIPGAGSSNPAGQPYEGGPIWVSKYIPNPDGCTTTDDQGNIAVIMGCSPGEWVSYELPPVNSALVLISNLGITDPAKRDYLNNHPEVADELFDYLQANGNTQEIRDFLSMSLNFLYSNPSVDIADFRNLYFNNNFTFDYSSNDPNNATPAPLLAPSNFTLVSLGNTSNGRRIGSTTNRGNTEDMTYGTGASSSQINQIKQSEVSKLNNDLFTGMTDLMHFFSIDDLETATDQFVQKFRNSTGGNFESYTVNSKVYDSDEFKNFAGIFNATLTNRLQAVNGDLSKVSEIKIDNRFRLAFSSPYHKIHGLQILINDTEYTEIQIDNYSLLVSGKWGADVTFTIHDHFGVDLHDATTYQSYKSGFADWWLLQHDRGYRPFETLVHITMHINGQL